MARNKTIDFVLLILVFSISAAGGWFLSEIIFNDKSSDDYVMEEVLDQPDEIVYEENEDSAEVEFLEESIEEIIEEEEIVEEKPKPIVYEAFTSEQMEALINSGDFGSLPATFNSKQIFRATNNNIVVRNLRPDDGHPDDVIQLCGKVADGFWKGVVNTVVHANEQNVITRVEVTVVYPEE